ncbi:hypothetical protein FRB97_006635 [Tulasnella sp. 331]|nr:hypothetical protein FRB97_006635 [Tulasnella sp. 331]
MSPSKVRGQAKESTHTIGARMAGLFGMRRAEANQSAKAAAGSAEVAAAKASGWTKGTGDRTKGKGNSMWGAITGNRGRQSRGNAQNNKGHIRVSINESHDYQFVDLQVFLS